jgi:hypothetical protein
LEIKNQNQEFKIRRFKFCLVWTDCLSQQIFEMYWTQIRPCSKKENLFPTAGSISVQIDKNYGGQQVFISRVQTGLINFFDLES